MIETNTTVLNNNSISHPQVGLYDPLQGQESWQLVTLRGASLLGLPVAEGSSLVPGHIPL